MEPPQWFDFNRTRLELALAYPKAKATVETGGSIGRCFEENGPEKCHPVGIKSKQLANWLLKKQAKLNDNDTLVPILPEQVVSVMTCLTKQLVILKPD